MTQALNPLALRVAIQAAENAKADGETLAIQVEAAIRQYRKQDARFPDGKEPAYALLECFNSRNPAEQMAALNKLAGVK